MNQKLRLLLMGFASLAVTACANSSFVGLEEMTKATDKTVGCLSFEDQFWDSLYHFPLNKKPFPPTQAFAEELEETLAQGRLSTLDREQRESLQSEINELYRLLTEDTVRTFDLNEGDNEKVLETLTALELGDRTTREKEIIQDKIRAAFARIENETSQSFLSSNCSSNSRGNSPPNRTMPPEKGTDNALLLHWKSSRHPIVFGALKSLATAYQSCEAGVINPMDTNSTPAEGIKEVGKHPNGVGTRREIGDLATFLKTNYYLNAYVKPQNQCFPVLEKPLIYDYGGKPEADESESSELDFFTNAGSGTKELGIDCSGYVYSALATAGLKLKKTGRLKAINVKGINARMYMNPQKNGLSCLENVTFKSGATIQPGDILASSGHVLIIGTVGKDPFGVEHITQSSDCTIENMSETRLNFTVYQSAPASGALGIQHNEARAYFKDDESYRNEILLQAVNACKARFESNSVATNQEPMVFTRHTLDLACRDQAIRLKNETCLASCQVPNQAGVRESADYL